MTDNDLRIVNDLQKKLKMIEDHHQDMTDQAKRALVSRISMDLWGMDLMVGAKESARKV